MKIVIKKCNVSVAQILSADYQKKMNALKNRSAQLLHTRNVFFPLTYPHEELDVLVCDLFDVASYRWRSDDDFIQETFVSRGIQQCNERKDDIELLEQRPSFSDSNIAINTLTHEMLQLIRSQRSY